MPELPEVEVVRTALAARIEGCRIEEASSPGGGRFSDAVLASGSVVDAVARRGKYLVLHLSMPSRLVVHLGMSGSLQWADEVPSSGFRAYWAVAGGLLVLRDPRGFGCVRVVPASGATGLPLLDRLGPEPFASEFSVERVRSFCAPVGAPVKSRLLAQEMVAGIGNYLADEICFRARVSPFARSLSRARASRLHAAVIEVVSESIEYGGVSVRDYVHVDGAAGDFASRLAVYGRAGGPCVGCGRVLAKGSVGGRTTVWCPSCQRA